MHQIIGYVFFFAYQYQIGIITEKVAKTDYMHLFKIHTHVYVRY